MIGMKAKVRKSKMKAYRMTQTQVDILKAVYDRLEDYSITDRRSRIIAANAILDLLEDIQKNVLVEVHDHHEKPKAAGYSAAPDKAISSPPSPAA